MNVAVFVPIFVVPLNVVHEMVHVAVLLVAENWAMTEYGIATATDVPTPLADDDHVHEPQVKETVCVKLELLRFVLIVTVTPFAPTVAGFGDAVGTDALAMVGNSMEMFVLNVPPMTLSPLAVAVSDSVPSARCLTPLQYISEVSPPTFTHEVSDTVP